MSSSDSTNTDTTTTIDSKASSQITTSGLITKFNNILSQSSEYQRYDGSIDNKIFSGGYSHCPYRTRPQCPYYQDKLRLLRQKGLNRNNKKQYFYYPMISNTNVSNNMDNKNIVNNRNIVSNTFLNYVNNKKNKPDEIVRGKNNSKKYIYMFEKNGKKYIGMREKYTFGNKSNNKNKGIKYINRIIELK